jgi:hypothetical protein
MVGAMVVAAMFVAPMFWATVEDAVNDAGEGVGTLAGVIGTGRMLGAHTSLNALRPAIPGGPGVNRSSFHE